jgi:serine/threonine protein phosphatase PrpC
MLLRTTPNTPALNSPTEISALLEATEDLPELPEAVELSPEGSVLTVQGPVGFDALVPVAPTPVPEEPAYKPKPDPWLCKQCNTLNIAEDEYCNVCGALRVSTPPPEPEQPVAQVDPEPQPDKLALVLAPRPEADPRLGWRYVAGQATNEGIARFGTPNEDSIFCLELERSFQSKPEAFGLYVVADGMGGQDAGEVASRMAIESISVQLMQEIGLRWLAGEVLEGDRVEATLRRAVQEAHHKVRNSNLETNRDSGTTLTSVCLIDNQAYFANVGDSRTYLFRPWKEGQKPEVTQQPVSRPGKTQKLARTDKLSVNGTPTNGTHAEAAATPAPKLEIQRVTRDQSLVQNLVDDGVLTIEQVYSDPRRNVVLNAIGSPDEDIPVDTYRRELEPGDTLLLCSDGMWEMARDPAIAELILSLEDVQVCSDELVALACRNGGADNVSVIVVKIERL